MKILIGHEQKSGRPVHLPVAALDRHMHMIGYTGAGKTTAIITLLQGLLANPLQKKCVIIIDRLGGFSLDLLRWFSSCRVIPSGAVSASFARNSCPRSSEARISALRASLIWSGRSILRGTVTLYLGP
jgi:hypothetical protein